MLIAARSIPKYFHSLTFPVDILEEKGPRIAFVVSRAQLLAMCDLSAVIAIGSYKHIKYFRVNRPVAEMERLRLKLFGTVPIAEDCRTVSREAQVFSFHRDRSNAFSPVSRKDFV